MCAELYTDQTWNGMAKGVTMLWCASRISYGKQVNNVDSRAFQEGEVGCMRKMLGELERERLRQLESRGQGRLG